jgi:hypothetical protein
MAHSKRKLEAAEKNRQLLKMDLKSQQNRLNLRKEELNSVKKAAEDAQGSNFPPCLSFLFSKLYAIQIVCAWPFWFILERATTPGFSTSYATLRGCATAVPSFVRSSSPSLLNISKAIFRKAAASVLAVDERQSLDTLMREEKTIGRVWSQLREQFADAQNQRDTLEEEANVWTRKKSEVCMQQVVRIGSDKHNTAYIARRKGCLASSTAHEVTSGSRQ